MKIAKINIDESPALAQQFNIDAIPHLFVFRNGQEVTDALGLQTEAQLLAMLGITTPAQTQTSVTSPNTAVDAAMATLAQPANPATPTTLLADPATTIADSQATAATAPTVSQSANANTPDYRATDAAIRALALPKRSAKGKSQPLSNPSAVQDGLAAITSNQALSPSNQARVSLELT